jgi:hypothetical protein
MTGLLAAACGAAGYIKLDASSTAAIGTGHHAKNYKTDSNDYHDRNNRDHHC